MPTPESIYFFVFKLRSVNYKDGFTEAKTLSGFRETGFCFVPFSSAGFCCLCRFTLLSFRITYYIIISLKIPQLKVNSS